MDGLNYVDPINFQKSGNDVGVKLDKDLESEASMRSDEEELYVQGEAEELDEVHITSMNILTEDKEQTKKMSNQSTKLA